MKVKLRRKFRQTVSRAAVAVVIAAAVAGCARETHNHGSQLDERHLQAIRPGAHTKNNVFAILGSPATTATFDGDAWYYIGGERAIRTPFADEELERTVLVVRFDPAGVVDEVEVLGLDQAEEVALVERETPSFGQSVTVMQQLLGNIGRFEDNGGDTSPTN